MHINRIDLANRKHLALTIGAGVLGLIAILWGGFSLAKNDGDAFTAGEDSPFFEVARGSLAIDVNVSGTIKAQDQEIIKCEVEGQTTILKIIEEGKRVKKGDLLVRLDASRLQDDLVDQEIKVHNAEAAYISAREGLEVAKNQAQADVDKAELAYRFAKEDLDNYTAGEFPLDRSEADADITLARGNLKRAEETLKGSKELAEKGFITQTELEADEQSLLKAQVDLQLSEARSKLLQDFTYKRSLAQYESDLSQAEMALAREKAKAAADVVQAEADLKAKELQYKREQEKMKKLEDQITKTEVYAPTDGLVVYATTGRGGFRGNEEPLAEGQTVREQQELIT